MSKNKNKSKRNTLQNKQIVNKNYANYFFIPILLAFIFITIAIRGFVIFTDNDTYSFIGKPFVIDYYSKGKFYVMTFLCAVILLMGIAGFKYLFAKMSKYLTIYLISSGVFILFSLLSACFSDYKTVSFIGLYEHAEGFIAFLCYIILFIYTIYSYKSSRDFKNIIIAILIVLGFTTFIGIFEYVGHSLFYTDFGKALIYSKIENYIEDIDVTYKSNSLQGPFIHHNYVGSFAALIIPIITITIMFAKSYKKRIVLIIAEVAAFFILFGSGSRAGIVGVCCAVIISIILFGRIIFKKWKIILASIASLAIIITSFNFITDGKIFSRIPLLTNDIKSVFKDTSDFNYLDEIPVKNLENVDGDMLLTLENKTLTISKKSGDFTFTDGNGNPVEFNEKDNRYTTSNPDFKNVNFFVTTITDISTYNDCMILNVKNPGKGDLRFLFKIYPDNTLHLLNNYGTMEAELDFPETFGFKGKEKIGSGRGFIWSNTIPMMKDTFLLGYGPDTYLFTFPQNNMLGKYYIWGTTSFVINKPYNIYLQTFINNGGIAFLAFMVIIVLYLIDCIRLYFCKKNYTKDYLIGSGICLGIIGYLSAGMFNDSMICIAPMFWILLGCGVAVNYQNRKEKIAEQN